MAKARNNRAVALLKLGRAEEALAACAEAATPELLGTRGNALLALARAEEALAAYEAALALAPEHAPLHDSRAAALLALGRAGEALAAAGQAAALGFAPAETTRGNALLALARPAEALAAFARAPAEAERETGRGVALAALGRHAEALACFARHPEAPNAAYNQGSALLALGRAEAALAALAAAPPDHPEAQCNRGLALQALGRGEAALAAFDAAIALRPDYVDAHWNKALALLQQGRLAEGWAEHEWRHRRAEVFTGRRHPQPAWRGEPMAGRRLLLHWEQGFGDTIQFSRYAWAARAQGARVVLAVQDALLPLFADCAGVEVVGAGAEPEFDAHCPLLSAPLACATTLASIPPPAPLRADPARRAAWAARLGEQRGPRIGLAWSGSPAHRNDAQRSLPLAQLAPLLAHPAEWVCLQPELRPGEEALAETLPLRRFPCPTSPKPPRWSPSWTWW